MAKILNSVVFNRQIQKIVETEKGLIINGHYYNKNSMTPVPFSALPAYGSIYDLAMNQKIILRCNNFSLRNKSNGDMIVIDQNNPNIKYVFTVSNRSENSNCIIKINESNGNCEHLLYSVLSGFPTTYGIVTEVIGQNDTYIFLMFETNNYRPYLYAMNKSTLAMTVIKDYGTYWCAYKIYEDETNVYLGVSYYGSNFIEKLNKMDLSLARIKATSNVNTSNTLGFCSKFSDIIKIDDDHFYTYAVRHSTSAAKIDIIRFDFDLTKKATFAEMISEVEPDILFTDAITKIPMFASNLAIVYEPFITYANNGKKYLNISISETHAASTAANYSSYGIYTFLINEEDNCNLVLKGFLNFGNIAYRGYLSIKDNNTVISASDQSLFFSNFSVDTESFVISETKNVNPYHIGIDKEENIWYVDGNLNVELVNSSSTNSLYMAWEKSYKYDGTDISTYIELAAKNIDGEFIVTNVQLTISGEATWNTNNTKTVNVTTSSEGIIQVPLTIKDEGNITITPKIIM